MPKVTTVKIDGISKLVCVPEGQSEARNVFRANQFINRSDMSISMVSDWPLTHQKAVLGGQPNHLQRLNLMGFLIGNGNSPNDAFEFMVDTFKLDQAALNQLVSLRDNFPKNHKYYDMTLGRYENIEMPTIPEREENEDDLSVGTVAEEAENVRRWWEIHNNNVAVLNEEIGRDIDSLFPIPTGTSREYPGRDVFYEDRGFVSDLIDDMYTQAITEHVNKEKWE